MPANWSQPEARNLEQKRQPFSMQEHGSVATWSAKVESPCGMEVHMSLKVGDYIGDTMFSKVARDTSEDSTWSVWSVCTSHPEWVVFFQAADGESAQATA